jgi:hypothetical protein
VLKRERKTKGKRKDERKASPRALERKQTALNPTKEFVELL